MMVQVEGDQPLDLAVVQYLAYRNKRVVCFLHFADACGKCDGDTDRSQVYLHLCVSALDRNGDHLQAAEGFNSALAETGHKGVHVPAIVACTDKGNHRDSQAGKTA